MFPDGTTIRDCLEVGHVVFARTGLHFVERSRADQSPALAAHGEVPELEVVGAGMGIFLVDGSYC
jgi:hypothetical protein